MKRIKVFIMALLLLVSFAFMPPTVQASDVTTTETTTEEITTEAVIDDSQEEIDIDVVIERVKTYIIAVVLSLFSAGTLSFVANIFFKRLLSKADKALEDAVSSNQISQNIANLATKMLSDGVDKIDERIVKLEQGVLTKVNNLDTDMKTLIEKIDTLFISNLKTALTEYFTEEEE
jgi:hypothetical protein